MADFPEVGLEALISGLSDFKKGADTIISAYEEINKKSDDTEKSSSILAQGFTAVSTGITAAIGVLNTVVGAFGAVGNAIVDTGSKAYGVVASYESLTKSLTAMTAQQILASGGAEDMASAMAIAAPQAKDLADWITKVALLSPLNEEGVQRAFQLGLNYRFTTEEAKRLTQAEIDFAAASNLPGEALERITRALGQMKGKPTVSAEELNQLREVGFPVSEVLDKMGFSLSDVEKKLVSSDAFIEAATQSMEVFKGQAAANATGLTGLATSFQDLMDIGIREFFQSTFEVLQPYLADFLNWFQEQLPLIREWGGILKDLVVSQLQILQTFLRAIGVDFDSLSDALKTVTGYARGFTDAFLGLSDADIITNMMDQTYKLDAQFKATTDSIQKQLSNLPKMLGDDLMEINQRYGPKIAELAEKFAEKRTEILDDIANEEQSHQDKLNGIAEQAAEKRQAIEERLAKARADTERKVNELTLKLEEDLAKKRADLAEKVTNINEKFAEAQKQIQADIKDKNDKYEEDKADTQEKFTDKRQTLEDKYAKDRKKLEASLAASNIDEEKAMIQQQLAALDAQKAEELATIDAEEKKELAKLDAKHQKEIAKLQEKLAAEDAERQKAIAKAQKEYDEDTAQLQKKYGRDVEELKRKLSEDEAEQSKALSKIDKEQQDAADKENKRHEKSIAEYQKRLDKETKAYEKQKSELEKQRNDEADAAKARNENMRKDLEKRLADENEAYKKQRKQIEEDTRERIKYLGKVQDALGQLQQSINKITDAWETLKQKFQSIKDTINSIIDWFNNMKKKISDTINEISQIWEKFKEDVNKIWNSISTAITNTWNTIYTNVVNKLNELKTSITNKWNEIKSAVEGIANSMISSITSIISNSASTISSAFSTTISSAIATVRGWVTAGGQFYTNLTGIGAELINGILAGISTGLDIANKIWLGLVYAVDTVLGWVKNTGYSIYTKAKEIGENIITAIKDNLIVYSNTASDLVNTLWSRLVSGIQQIVSWAGNAGYALYKVIVNLADAIMDAMIDAIRSLNNVGQRLINAIIDAITKSPEIAGAEKLEAVFAYQGQILAGSLLAGIVSGLSNKSAISNALSGLASFAQAGVGGINLSAGFGSVSAPAVAAPALAGGGGSTNIYNTYNVGGNTINSNMDAAIFEQRVLNVIRKNLS